MAAVESCLGNGKNGAFETLKCGPDIAQFFWLALESPRIADVFRCSAWPAHGDVVPHNVFHRHRLQGA